MSFQTGQIPLEWKSANVTPVLKNGDETQMENYRPISVLPVIAKIMERIVFNQLYCFLQQHSMLTQHQSGFRPNHSTQDVLIKTIDDWRKSVDDDCIVGALFLDLSKAFDLIDHELLLKKMQLSLVSREMQRSGSGSVYVEGAKEYVLDRPLHVGKHQDLGFHKGPFWGH